MQDDVSAVQNIGNIDNPENNLSNSSTIEDATNSSSIETSKGLEESVSEEAVITDKNISAEIVVIEPEDVPVVKFTHVENEASVSSSDSSYSNLSSSRSDGDTRDSEVVEKNERGQTRIIDDSDDSICEIPVPPKPTPLIIDLETSEGSQSSSDGSESSSDRSESSSDGSEIKFKKRKAGAREKSSRNNKRIRCSECSISVSDSENSITASEDVDWAAVACSQINEDKRTSGSSLDIRISEITDNLSRDVELRDGICQIIGDSDSALVGQENPIGGSERKSVIDYSYVTKKTSVGSSETSLVIDEQLGEEERLSLSREIFVENNEKGEDRGNGQNVVEDDALIINAECDGGLLDLIESRAIETSDNRKRASTDGGEKSELQNSPKKFKSSDHSAAAVTSSSKSPNENEENGYKERNCAADYFSKPMNNEMDNYYSKSWGGETFDIDAIRRQMPRDSRHRDIQNEDLLGNQQQRSIYCTESKSSNSKQTDHHIAECPEKRKLPSCHICGTQGHGEPHCPHEMCPDTSHKDVNTHLNVEDVTKPQPLLGCNKSTEHRHGSTTCDNCHSTQSYVPNYTTGTTCGENGILESVECPSKARDRKEAEDIQTDGGVTHKSLPSNEERKKKSNTDEVTKGNMETDEFLHNISKATDKNGGKTGEQLKEHRKSNDKEIQKSIKPLEIQKSSKPLEIQKSIKPLEIQKSSKPLEIQKSSKPLEIQKSSKPQEIQKSSKSLEIQKSSKPQDIQKSSKSLEIQKSSKPLEIQKSSKPLEIQKSSKPLEIQKSTKPLEIQKSIKPMEMQKSIKPMEMQKSIKPLEIQKSSKPLKIQKSIKPLEIQKSIKPLEIQKSIKPPEIQESIKPLPTNCKAVKPGEFFLEFKSELLYLCEYRADFGEYKFSLLSTQQNQYDRLSDALSREFFLNLISQFPIKLEIERYQSGEIIISIRSIIDLHGPIRVTIMDWLAREHNERDRFVKLNLPMSKEDLVKLLTEKLNDLKQDLGDPIQLYAEISSLKQNMETLICESQSKAEKSVEHGCKKDEEARIVEKLNKALSKLNMILFGQMTTKASKKGREFLKTALYHMQKARSPNYICAATYLQIVHHYNIIFAAYSSGIHRSLLITYWNKYSGQIYNAKKIGKKLVMSVEESRPAYENFIRNFRKSNPTINTAPRMMQGSQQIIPHNISSINSDQVESQFVIPGENIDTSNNNLHSNLPSAKIQLENNNNKSKSDFGDISKTQKSGGTVQSKSQQDNLNYTTLNIPSFQKRDSSTVDSHKKTGSLCTNRNCPYETAKNNIANSSGVKFPRSNSSSGKNIQQIGTPLSTTSSSKRVLAPIIQTEPPQNTLRYDVFDIQSRNERIESKNIKNANGPKMFELHDPSRIRSNDNPCTGDKQNKVDISRNERQRKKDESTLPLYLQKRAEENIGEYIKLGIRCITRAAREIQESIKNKNLTLQCVVNFEKLIESELKQTEHLL